MKQSKKDVSLCERDALQDVLDAEDLLTAAYAAALTAGSGAAFCKKICSSFADHAATRRRVEEQLLGRGYLRVRAADPALLHEAAERFLKAQKQLTALHNGG